LLIAVNVRRNFFVLTLDFTLNSQHSDNLLIIVSAFGRVPFIQAGSGDGPRIGISFEIEGADVAVGGSEQSQERR
jgi:hypothetical protein